MSALHHRTHAPVSPEVRAQELLEAIDRGDLGALEAAMRESAMQGAGEPLALQWAASRSQQGYFLYAVAATHEWRGEFKETDEVLRQAVASSVKPTHFPHGERGAVPRYCVEMITRALSETSKAYPERLIALGAIQVHADQIEAAQATSDKATELGVRHADDLAHSVETRAAEIAHDNFGLGLDLGH